MTGYDDDNDITWKGYIGPRAAAAIGAVAGLATSRRKMKGAVVGGAVGWAMAHFMNKRRKRKEGIVDIVASEAAPDPDLGNDPEPETNV